MMISPDGYRELLVGASLEELRVKRDALMASVRRFEKRQHDEREYLVDPSPEVVYQMELLYLAKVCELLCDEYNRTVIWGEDALDA